MDRLRRLARSLRSAPTDAEQLLRQHLRREQLGGFRFRRQVPMDRYIADFVGPRARRIVELDGGQHVERQQYDAARTAYLQAMGYRVLRLWNDDVLKKTKDVLEHILPQLTPLQPSPSLAAQGREHKRRIRCDTALAPSPVAMPQTGES